MPTKKRSITLDSLARMVQKGFEETATKRDITRLDGRIDGLDGRIDEIAVRLGRVEAKLDRALYKEVARLEDLIRQLARKTHVKLEY